MIGAPVPVAALDVVAEVPESLQTTGREASWLRARQGVPAPRAFLEGPVPAADGGLYLVDVAWGRLLHLSSDGEFGVLLECGGEPNGLALGPGGALVIADYQRGLRVVEDPTAAAPEARTLAGAADHGFIGLNDVIVDRHGAAYVTDQGDSGLHDPSGSVRRCDAGGRVSMVIDGLPSPNGLLLDEDDSTLYVAMTRDNAIWRIPLTAEGPGRVGRFIQLSGGIGPDGLARGPLGSFLVAHLGRGVVMVYDRTGEPAMVLRSPRGLAVTNLCPHPDGTLYVTESETATVLGFDLSRLADVLEGSAL